MAGEKLDRLADLHRQGFMRGRRSKRVAKPRPIVACEQCQDWHPKGKHRKANQKDPTP